MEVIKKILLKITEGQSKVILLLVYMLILPVFVLVYKILKLNKPQGWVKWSIKSDSLDDLRRQF